MPDQHKNFAYSTVATAPSPATSGTSLTVAAGHGARFPAVPFNATVWPAGAQPTVDNAEIIRVTAIATDTFTIVRAQEGTTARAVVVGDQVAATITKKTMDDIEAIFAAWTAYSVVWTALTTNPVIGNGVLTGRFLRMGKTVFCAVLLQPGSTTTFGTGEWRFTLPSEAKGVEYIGTAYSLDAGTAHHDGIARVTDLTPAPSKAGVYESGAGAYQSNVPFVWTNGDTLLFSFTYEEA